MVVVDAGIAQSALEDRIACDLQHDLILVKVLKGNCKPDSTPWTCLVCKFTSQHIVKMMSRPLLIIHGIKLQSRNTFFVT